MTKENTTATGGQSLLGDLFQLRPKNKLSGGKTKASDPAQKEEASGLDRLAAKLSSTLPSEPKAQPEVSKKPLWNPDERKEAPEEETAADVENGKDAHIVSNGKDADALSLPVPSRGKDTSVVPHGLVRSPSGNNLVGDEMQFPFGCRFTFWLAKDNASAGTMQGLGSCSDVHEFWRCWNSIAMDKLPPGTSLSVFRTPERPWPEGRRGPGGRWMVVCNSSSEASRMEMFERLVLALVGGLFDEEHEGAPWGVALPASRSEANNAVQVWNKSATKLEGPTDELKNIVGDDAVIEFKPHQTNKDKTKDKSEAR